MWTAPPSTPWRRSPGNWAWTPSSSCSRWTTCCCPRLRPCRRCWSRASRTTARRDKVLLFRTEGKTAKLTWERARVAQQVGNDARPASTVSRLALDFLEQRGDVGPQFAPRRALGLGQRGQRLLV